MSPEEIIEAYNVLSQDVKDNVATEAARVGNAQRSLGTLAERVASPSGQTSGLANYTYNRTLRPVVDSLATQLVTTGKAAALENKLNSDLRAAKNAYEDAKNAYTVASSTPKTTGNSGDKYKEETGDNPYTKTSEEHPAKGTVLKQTANGDGTWTFDVADGNGGVNSVKVNGKSKEQAQSDYEYNYYSDGTKKNPYARGDSSFPINQMMRYIDGQGHNYVVE